MLIYLTVYVVFVIFYYVIPTGLKKRYYCLLQS